MTNQSYDPLKELEAALAVEPSPAFAARVRTRIAESGSRSSSLAWQGMAAAAFIVVVVLGGITWRTNQVRVGPGRAGAIDATAVAPHVTPPAGPMPVAASTAGGRVGAAVVATRSRAPEAPEALVPPDQAIALNRLMATLQEQRAARREAADAPFVVIEQLVQIKAVQVEPIRIDLLVSNSLPPGGKEKDR